VDEQDDQDDRPGTSLVTTVERSVAERVQEVSIASNFVSGRLQIHQIDERRTVLEMSVEHSKAMIETARYSIAVPEEQRTIRSQQQTKRQWISALVIIACAIIIAMRPESGTSIAAMVAVLGTGVIFGEYFNREKKKELPPSDEKKDLSPLAE
jgi:hypothetical protein